MSGIDLHTHTVASDGTYTPAELVSEAVRRGVRVLAVTDELDETPLVPAASAVGDLHPEGQGPRTPVGATPEASS